MMPMMDLLKQLRLSGLADELPRLIEEARQSQLSYEAFLTCVLQQDHQPCPTGGPASPTQSEAPLYQPYRSLRLPLPAVGLQAPDARTGESSVFGDGHERGAARPTGRGQDPSGLRIVPQSHRSWSRGALHDAQRTGAAA